MNSWKPAVVLMGAVLCFASVLSAQQVKTDKVGTLVIDLFDTKTKNLLWRGSASDTLSNNSSKNIKNLDKGLDKLFRIFPPGSKR
jgi:Domain of unknown function (DUF4136)